VAAHDATTTYVEGRSTPWAARALVVLFGGSTLAGLVLAPLAGWLWVTVSDPPKAPLFSNGGVYLGEQGLNQQAGVTLWFIVIGAAFGLVAGLVIGWFGQRFGWLSVAAVLVLCVVGSIGSRYLGVHSFGPDPRAEIAHAQVGDLIQVRAGVDTWVAYLGWPIGGLLGALAAIAGWNRSDDPPQNPQTSRTLSTHPHDASTVLTAKDDNGRHDSSTRHAWPTAGPG
jgi:hypothetical protein